MNFSPIKRRSVLQGMAALGSTGLLGTALAQTGKAAWPTKPIRLVVPFNAGGATDIIARTVGEALSKRIGQPVVVDNKGGAAGILGTDAVAKAPADGHTLLLTLSTSMLINQFLYTKLPYNPQKDLALITQVAAAPVTLVVHPSVPANNMKELLAYVKAQKGKLSYGSWGTGSYAHLAGAYMSKNHRQRHGARRLQGRGAHDPGADWRPVAAVLFERAQYQALHRLGPRQGHWRHRQAAHGHPAQGAHHL